MRFGITCGRLRRATYGTSYGRPFARVTPKVLEGGEEKIVACREPDAPLPREMVQGGERYDSVRWTRTSRPECLLNAARQRYLRFPAEVSGESARVDDIIGQPLCHGPSQSLNPPVPRRDSVKR